LVQECDSAFEDEDVNVLVNIKIPNEKLKQLQTKSSQHYSFLNYGNKTYLDKIKNTDIEGIIGKSL
jgi:hypothetical protein